MKNKKTQIIIWFIFSVYLALLIKVILFKYPIDMIITILKSDEIPSLSTRLANSNFIPMKSISNFLFKSQNFRISMRNILGNIIAFVPLGFLLPLTFDKISKFRFIILSSFLISLVFEVIQLLTAIGDFDIDDIILNVLGTLCGYLIYLLFNNLRQKCYKTCYREFK